jgi:hypothetical protein
MSYLGEPAESAERAALYAADEHSQGYVANYHVGVRAPAERLPRVEGTECRRECEHELRAV